MARGVPDIENGMVSLGVRHECVGVLSLGIPVAEQGAQFSTTNAAIVAAGQHAVRTLGAEALVLACGGMAQAETIVRERVGVPATNGVAFGALLAHALWRAGLRTSQVGSLAPPAPPAPPVPPTPASAPPAAPLGTAG
ncbi:MAG: aspartate/glutamate racemase family protein [Solirubrobacteraceae bacterium]